MELNPKVAQGGEIHELRKLSTERLIVWIVGRSKELGLKLTPEDIVLETRQNTTWMRTKMKIASQSTACQLKAIHQIY